MDRQLLFLSAFFITCLLVSNIIASKVINLAGITLPAAVVIFPLTFLITDTINEVWGKKAAQEIVWLGFAMSVIMILLLQLGQFLPPAPHWEHQEAYEAILGAVPRMVAASLTAYLFSQLHDVWAFNFWKKITKDKHLWLRNNLSTLSSQLVDSVFFISIAFVGTMPGEALITLMINQYLIKVGLAILDTPLIYLAVNWIRQRKEGLAVDR